VACVAGWASTRRRPDCGCGLNLQRCAVALLAGGLRFGQLILTARQAGGQNYFSYFLDEKKPPGGPPPKKKNPKGGKGTHSPGSQYSGGPYRLGSDARRAACATRPTSRRVRRNHVPVRGLSSIEPNTCRKASKTRISRHFFRYRQELREVARCGQPVESACVAARRPQSDARYLAKATGQLTGRNSPDLYEWEAAIGCFQTETFLNLVKCSPDAVDRRICKQQPHGSLVHGHQLEPAPIRTTEKSVVALRKSGLNLACSTPFSARRLDRQRSALLKKSKPEQQFLNFSDNYYI